MIDETRSELSFCHAGGDRLLHFTSDGARIFAVILPTVPYETARVGDLSDGERETVGCLEAFACCVAFLQKDVRASVSVKATLNGEVFRAYAERSGTVCGQKDEATDLGDAVFPDDSLEVTLHLPLRGNYTGSVCGNGLNGLTDSYFRNSLQISARCETFTANGASVCVLAEALPGEPCDCSALCDRVRAAMFGGEIPDGWVFAETFPFAYGCTCSRAAVLRTLNSLPESEKNAAAENGKIVTRCGRCGKKYTFEV